MKTVSKKTTIYRLSNKLCASKVNDESINCKILLSVLLMDSTPILLFIQYREEENHKIFWYSELFYYLCSIRTCQAS